MLAQKIETEFVWQRHPMTVLEMCDEIIRIMDLYRSRKVSDQQLKEAVVYWATYESEKMFEGPTEYKKTIKKMLGKKRLNLLDKMLAGFQPNLY